MAYFLIICLISSIILVFLTTTGILTINTIICLTPIFIYLLTLFGCYFIYIISIGVVSLFVEYLIHINKKDLLKEEDNDKQE